MAIYEKRTVDTRLLETLRQSRSTQSTRNQSTDLPRARQLIEEGKYQAAYDLIHSGTQDVRDANTEAVLLMRLGKPGAAIQLLRNCVWDLTTFMLKADVPVHVQLNFATALLLSGQVSSCLSLIRSLKQTGNEQADELLAEIRSWERSLSLLSKFDWKICRIEHLKGNFPIRHLPGRFGWEASSQHHELAC